MQVQWTRRALRRLDQHASYIATWSAKAADEMAQRVRLHITDLAAHPLLGREGRYPGTRELVVEKGRYVVIYRVRGQIVQVITIHDTRQQWPADWRNA